MRLTRRSLFRGLAGAFVGSLLARTPLAGADTPEPEKPVYWSRHCDPSDWLPIVRSCPVNRSASHA